jgi:hypothetical protein
MPGMRTRLTEFDTGVDVFGEVRESGLEKRLLGGVEGSNRVDLRDGSISLLSQNRLVSKRVQKVKRRVRERTPRVTGLEKKVTPLSAYCNGFG